MKKPSSVKALEEFGRVQLSTSFYMREFLNSEIATIARLPNIPDDPDLAIAAGTQLCEEILEPLQETFGRVAIRSAFRSCEVNAYGNTHKLNCARNERNYGHHIWDRRDSDGFMGATACIVLPWFAHRYENGANWQEIAWWIHDHLPYSEMMFFPKRAAFNIQWHERPSRTIYSHVAPRGHLTKPGQVNHDGDHSTEYARMLTDLATR